MAKPTTCYTYLLLIVHADQWTSIDLHKRLDLTIKNQNNIVLTDQCISRNKL